MKAIATILSGRNVHVNRCRHDSRLGRARAGSILCGGMLCPAARCPGRSILEVVNREGALLTPSSPVETFEAFAAPGSRAVRGSPLFYEQGRTQSYALDGKFMAVTATCRSHFVMLRHNLQGCGTHCERARPSHEQEAIMDRRDFLKAGVQASVVGAAASSTCSTEAAQGAAAAVPKPIFGPAPGIFHYSAAEHRRRLENIARCEQTVRRCLRKHLVTNYLPGQCCYNLGEYPCRKPWDPGEYDERNWTGSRTTASSLIQVFDDWNDSLRLFGGDKYTALNPAGFRRFIDMVHRRGMKMLTYASTCFLQRTDPDFRQEWSREGRQPAWSATGTWPAARRPVPAGGPSCCRASPGSWTTTTWTASTSTAATCRTSANAITAAGQGRSGRLRGDARATTGRSPTCWP